MQNFKFRYENLLNLFKNKEKEIMNELSIAQNDLKEEIRILNNLVDLDKNYNLAIEDNLKKGCYISFIKNINQYKSKLNEQINYQNFKINRTEEEIKNIRQRLINLNKEKKIMEKLKEKKLMEHNLQIKATEEKMIDEIVTYLNRTNIR